MFETKKAASKKNAIKFLKDVLMIESVSGNELELARYLKRFLEQSDYQILSSKVGNVIGIKGSGDPVLMLASHMDTVPTDNPFRVVGDKIYATGATDCKPSLASMFYAASKEEWKEGEGTLILAAIVEEEVSVKGIKDLFFSLENVNLRPDYAIFGEPTKVDRICVGYRGRIALKLRVNALPGHSSSNWGFDNAIEVLLAIYSKIKSYARNFNSRLNENCGYFDKITATITKLHSGEVANSVPKKAEAEIDIRIPHTISIKEITKDISQIASDREFKSDAKFSFLENHQLKDSTSINHEYGATYNGVKIPNNALVANALRWAAFKTLDRKIKMLNKTGSTFMNIIQDKYGDSAHKDFACIVYGPGNPRLEHTSDEFVEIPNYLKAIQVYSKFFPKFKDIFKKTQMK